MWFTHILFAVSVLSAGIAAAKEDECTWKNYENTLIVMAYNIKYKLYSDLTREACQAQCAKETAFVCKAINYEKAKSNCWLVDWSLDQAQDNFKLRIGDAYSAYDLMTCENGAMKKPDCTWKTYQETLVVMNPDVKYKLVRGITREMCKDRCQKETDINCQLINFKKDTKQCFLVQKTVQEAKNDFTYRTPYTGYDLMVCEEKALPPKEELCTWKTYKDELIVMGTGTTYTLHRSTTRDECIQLCRKSTAHKCVSINYHRATSNCYLVDVNKDQAKELNRYRNYYSGFDLMACELVEVNGGWSDWKASGDCTKSCGGGTKSFTRTCTNPAPKNGGDDCVGDSTKTERCNTDPCPINGGWSDWAAGDCSKSCGGGSKTLTRTCTNPAPKHGGKNCEGDSTKKEDCNTNACPINGGWTAWSKSGSCSKSCGKGSQKFTRACTNPAPQHGGNDCKGDSTKTEDCNTNPCPVNGGWSSYSKSGSCSKSCGTGSQKYVRSCNNPTPAYGGKNCSGSSYKYASCNTQKCPINGGWSGYSKSGSCSKSCGSGSQKYVRSCNNPTPAYGGKNCSGSSYKYVTCNTHLCPTKYDYDFGQSISSRRYLDAWSNAMYVWEPHRPVSYTGTVRQWKFYARRTGTIYLQVFRKTSTRRYTIVGQTKATVTRTGSNSVYANIPIKRGDVLGFYFPGSSIIPFDGHECTSQRALYVQRPSASSVQPGRNFQFYEKQRGWNPCRKYSQIAVISASKINGGWTGWSKYGSCSKSCGSGDQKYTRSCSNPRPAYGGASCSGSSTKTEKCNTQNCPRNGGWSSYSKSGSCSRSCGRGTQRYVRTCTNPTPAYGGKNCSGSSYTYTYCNTHSCPRNGGWSSYVKSGSCSRSCGRGTQRYVRSCTNPTPAYGGKSCSGSSYTYTYCNTHSCPKPRNGGWSSYVKSGSCSRSCGRGTQKYVRSCTNPTPAYGGKNCSGSSYTYTYCNTHSCPRNGGWSSYVKSGSCSRSCGRGYQRYVRSCTNPTPAYGGKSCSGSSYTYTYCNTHTCPKPRNGGWSSYVKSGSCSRSCGRGTQKYVRSCNNPTPAYGGKNCSGSSYTYTYCNTHSCPRNGGWSSYVKSGSCSRSCGRGTQRYVRSCTNPTPAYGGKSCSGSSYTYTYCNTHSCPRPRNGGWSSYVKSGSCSRSCGSGTQRYVRYCNNPTPAYGGRSCSGSSYTYTYCNTHRCPSSGVDFGHSISYRRYLDSWSNAMYITEPHRPVTTSGTVRQWKFYARRTGTIYLQVFRRWYSNYFYLRGQTYVRVTRTGANTVSANIPISRGDYIGFYFPGHSIIPFDGSECYSQRSLYVQRPSVRVGARYYFSTKQTGWNPCRRYSQIAVISSSG